MLNLGECRTNWSSKRRYAVAIAIFLIALLLRFLLVPVKSSLTYVTFYPAMVLAFYLCGTGAGALVVALASLSGYFIFTPPFWTFALKQAGVVGATVYTLTATMIGLAFRELHQTSDKLRNLAEEQQAMLNNDLVGIVKIVNRRVVWRNQAASRIIGYEVDELLESDVRRFYPDEESYIETGKSAYEALKTSGVYRSQLELVRKDGRKIWVEARGALLPGQPDESLWMFTDITELKLHQTEIENLAFHDPLTGLPNRMLLSDRIVKALAQAERSQRLTAVCYLDLDGFKLVNDQFGHVAGDILLQETAQRMLASVRAQDTVCRLGGDEFVILLTNLENVEEYELAIQRIVETLNVPFTLDNAQTVHVSASIGISIAPFDSTDADTLIRHADQAMYKAKQAGRNRVTLYSAEGDY